MGIVEIKQRLKDFKRKYFLNILIKNLIFFLSISLIISLLALIVDYISQAGVVGRTLIFYISVFLVLGSFAWLMVPWILGYFDIGSKTLSDEKAAALIGEHYEDIKDKLLNALQLEKLSSQDSGLVLAGINQKIRDFQSISFTGAINLRLNLKYARYLAVIILVITISGLSAPSLIKDSSTRLLNHNQEFEKPVPFNFQILNQELQAYKGEDFTLEAQITGEFIPDELYINLSGRLVKMKKSEKGLFKHRFLVLQQSFDFSLFAAGYESQKYSFAVYPLPEMKNFEVFVDYPSYTGLKDYQVSNIGNFTIPEGSQLRWLISGENTSEIQMLFDEDSTLLSLQYGSEGNEISKTFSESTGYEISMLNEFGKNKETIQYEVEVTKDQYPEINAEIFIDTILYEFVVLSGTISDDYGLRNLQIITTENDNILDRIPIEINKNSKNQSFYKRLIIDSLKGEEDTKIYASVRDNDQINGSKESRSRVFSLKRPDRSSIDASLAKKSSDTENDIDESIKKAESLNEQLKELEDRLKTKPEIEWQEEKLINDILEQRKQIEENLEKLREQYEELRLAENKFNDRSKNIQEKADNLQQIMNEVLDEETKKLYDELKKLLEEAEDTEKIQQQLSKITPNERNLEKELERALELFKRLKLESKLEKTAKDLQDLGEKQDKLAKETLEEKKENNKEKEGSKTDAEENEGEQKEEGAQNKDIENESGDKSGQEKQQEVKEDFEKLKREIEEAEKLNQELKKPEPLQNTNQDQEQIDKLLEEIEKQLQENQKQKAGQNQQKSGNQMKQLGKKMESMQMSMEMEMIQENVDQLRQILDDLIKLSFNQEELMDAFREVNQVDPRYVELSQEQLKLKDDAKVIEDSLLSLASRVAQISTFVTREVAEVNKNIDNAMEDLRERNKSKALSDQQFAMTSINNLALLLDDILQNMQMAMSEAMGNPQQSQKGNQNLPNLKELQQQLSQQISDIKKSGMEGRKLSEELARMAAEQEMIRQEMKKLQESLEGQMGNEKAGGNLGELQKLMEENEIDLVNKKLTRELIERQKEIMTRMLEAEESLREQELDPERKGEQANEYQRPLPPAYKKYLEEKKKEIELLKSLPLEYNPFYKKEVNDYFRRLTSDN